MTVLLAKPVDASILFVHAQGTDLEAVAQAMGKENLSVTFRTIEDLYAEGGLNGTLQFKACIALVEPITAFGFSTGSLLKGIAPEIPLFAIVSDSMVASCELAARHGADYIFSPLQSWDERAAKIKQVVTRTPGRAMPLLIKKESLLTSSSEIAKTLHKAERLGLSGQSILITGPTGAGKELLAQVISKAGGARPLMSINCAAVPESLMEAELFGYAKGAFSGAAKESNGLIAQANGGVLFLDEVGELSQAMQAKLLRVLDTGEVRPLGGNKITKVHFQLICATHRDIDPESSQSVFRQDLYYRIASVTLSLPPLKDRISDIALLAQYFAATQSEGDPRSFTSEALLYLQSIPWPGNVRELRNFVAHCAMLTSAATIGFDLVQKTKLSWLYGLGATLAQDVYERDVLLMALELSKKVVSEAAKLCNKNRTEMYRLIKRYGIDGYRLL